MLEIDKLPPSYLQNAPLKIKFYEMLMCLMNNVLCAKVLKKTLVFINFAARREEFLLEML